MPRRQIRTVVVLAAALLGIGAWGAVPGASGAEQAAEVSKTQLGIAGNAQRFAQQTGQRSTILHNFVGWHQGWAWPQILDNLRPVPMVALIAHNPMTPLGISRGKGDEFLLQLNSAVADFGGRVYVRPLPEMNGHWNEYCAYNRDGSSRGAQYSTKAFKKAFARVAIIARGGPARTLNAKLKRLGLPGIGNEDLPTTKARIVWNPQGYGSPDLPGNSAQAYYPGNAYVDVVANDLYRQSTGAAWEANEALYRAYPGKPYAIAEWGLWGIDDPAFVQRMATFVRSHGRIEFIAWFNAKQGTIFDLASKPRSRAAYRRLITPLGR
jgi:hypothetical protein